MMKLKYELSQKSSDSQEILINRVISVLDELEYKIETRTSSTISFKDYSGQFGSTHKILKKVDSGIFRITKVGDTKLITFTYYVSFLPELVITAIITIVALIQNFYPAIFLAIPLFIQLILRINSLKEASKEMIDRIVI